MYFFGANRAILNLQRCIPLHNRYYQILQNARYLTIYNIKYNAI